MSSSAQKPPRSVSSHSSHHSSIEPRGAPEFNREYARQLSLAKKSRSASRTQGRSAGGDGLSPTGSASGTPVTRSPPPAPAPSAVPGSRFSPLGSLFASAKELVATTPTRRASPHVLPTEETPRVPMSQKPPLAPPTPSASPRASDDASKAAAAQTTPRPPRSAGAMEDQPAAADGAAPQDSSDGVSVVRVIQLVLLVWVVVLVLFCGVALFTAEDAAYRPHYFSFRSHPVNASAAPAVAYKPHGVDRLVPQVCRQLALRLRHCARLAGTAFMSGGQLQVLGMVMSDVADGILMVLQGIYDRVLAPMTAFMGRHSARMWSAVTAPFSAARGGANASEVLASLFLPVKQVTNFMVVDPTRAVLDTTLSFFVSGGDALRYLYFAVLSDLPGLSHRNLTATGAAVHPVDGAVTAEPNGLQRLWRRGKRATRTLVARGKNATTAWRAREAPADADSRPAAPAAPVTFSFTAHYQRGLDGDLWREILAADTAQVKDLVVHEVVAALKLAGPTAVTNVRLRPGSLLIDVDVTQDATATPHAAGKKNGALSRREQRAAQQKAVDEAKGALQRWPFSSVKAFYESHAQKIEARHAEERRAREDAAQVQRQRAAEVAAEKAKTVDEYACLRTATPETVKHCKTPVARLSELCGDLLTQATAAQGTKCDDKVAALAAQSEKAARQAGAEHDKALSAAKKECANAVRATQKAADDAQKTMRATLDKCQSTVKEQQDACRHQLESIQRDAAAGGEKSVAAAAAACEARVATEAAHCEAEKTKALKQHTIDHAAALDAAKRACEAATQKSADEQKALHGALDKCESTAKAQQDVCRHQLENVQRDAAAGNEKSVAAAAAACEARVATEAAHCEAEKTKALKQQTVDHATALDAAKRACEAASQKASEDAQKTMRTALDKCEHTAKAQQDACRQQLTNIQRDTAAGGEKSVVAAAAACEARVASEAAHCEAEMVKAQKQHAADQAAALGAAEAKWEHMHAEAMTSAAADCKVTSEKDLTAAVSKAEQECTAQQQAAHAKATQSMDEAYLRAQRQLNASQARAAQCVVDKAAAEGRLASATAAWEAEKTALVATTAARESDLQAQLTKSAEAARGSADKTCEARVEAAVAETMHTQHEACATELTERQASLEASCTATTAEALHEARTADAEHVARLLASQREGLASEGGQQWHEEYLALCTAACQRATRTGRSDTCATELAQLRAALTSVNTTSATWPPSLLSLLNHSAGRGSETPVCALAWHPHAALDATPTTTTHTAARTGWRAVVLVALTLLAAGGVTFLSLRVALRQHRAAVLLRETVRKLEKEVASLEQEATHHRVSSSSTSRAETPVRPSSPAASAAESRAHAPLSPGLPRPLVDSAFAAVLEDHLDTMTAWHFTCCNLLWMSASGTMPSSPAEGTSHGAATAPGAFGDDALTSPPHWRDWSATAARQTPPAMMAAEPADAETSHPPSPRDRTAPSTPTQSPIAVPAHGDSPSQLERRLARSYYYMLESYYVDLLESVTNRELIEHQLEEMEDVASKQMNLLQTQSSAVERLQEEVSASAKELATTRKQHQAECAAYQQQIAKQKAAPVKELEALRAELDRAKDEARQAVQMRNLQSETVAVLEEQLNRVTAAMQASQVPAAAPSDVALSRPNTSTSPRQGGAPPQMTRARDDRREYRQLDWRDLGDSEP